MRWLIILALIPSLVFAQCQILGAPTPTPSPSFISAAWVNTGEDKVTQDEIGTAANSSVWNGTLVNLFGAKNEVVSFNVILESTAGASNVSVEFSTLTGPTGNSISTTTSDPWNYVGRNIELFYVRYLQIKGLSLLSYQLYDERHIPLRMRRPWSGPGTGSGLWTDRPDHDKYYPEIAVPIELVPTFNIAANKNQSIWVDIYIPKTVASGSYNGTFSVLEAGRTTKSIPVALSVRNFELPDVPNSKTMLYLSYPNINDRYVGVRYPQTTADENLSVAVQNKHFQMAHRHKMSMIDDNDGMAAWTTDAPRPQWASRLDGTLFSAASGYDGPGVDDGNNVYSIATYGKWTWAAGGESAMRTHTNAWEQWFITNSSSTERFLYLIDESTNYAQTNTWAQWMNNNPGVGSTLRSFATAPMLDAYNSAPQLDICATWSGLGVTASWNTAAAYFNGTGKGTMFYNGRRPETGSFATEDDGVALRVNPWGQYKLGIDRWFTYETTYWNDYQGGRGQTHVFSDAQVYGAPPVYDSVKGNTSWNHTNGDGVLFYPGTDLVYPSDSYGVAGPIASLRMKHWRRGIQDVDYLALAAAIDPSAVTALVNSMVPDFQWEYGVNDANDPTWVQTDISWSTNPDTWEAARAALAAIIEE